MPQKNILLTAQDSMFDDIVPVAHDLALLGYNIFATQSTQEYLHDKGVKATLLSFPGEIVSRLVCFRGGGVPMKMHTIVLRPFSLHGKEVFRVLAGQATFNNSDTSHKS